MRTIKNIHKNKKPLANISLSVATIVVLFFLIELTFFCLNNFSADRTETIGKYCVNDPITGYKPQPDSSKHVIKRYKSGKIIYDVTYTIDDYGRRITKQKSKADSYVIFLGDSLIFGEGLNDEETLPYYFSALTKSSVYNYGCSGYGPNMMLAQLSERGLGSEIKEKRGIAIYLFIDDHIRRVIGDIYVDDRAPFFCLDKNDELIREGSFLTAKPIRRAIYNLLRRSQTFKYFKIALPISITKDDIFFTSRIINRSAEIYRSKFNGTFYLLIYPRMNDYAQEVVALLNKSNIQVLDYRDLFKGYDITDLYIEGDGHPTFLANKIIAEKIKKDIGY